MKESRQMRRARERRESRRAQFDRVHGEVLASKTIGHMWRMYFNNRFAPHGIDKNDPAVQETVEAAFYAGVAAMFELMNRVSPDDITEEQGMEMLSRLQEELEIYVNRQRA